MGTTNRVAPSPNEAFRSLASNLANNSLRTENSPLTTEEIKTLEATLRRDHEKFDVPSVLQVSIGQIHYRALEQQLKDIVAAPEKHADVLVVAARELMALQSNLAQCKAAKSDAAYDQVGFAAMKAMIGFTPSVPTDPRLALCPK